MTVDVSTRHAAGAAGASAATSAPRLLPWIAVSCVLLCVGFAALVLGMLGLGALRADDAQALSLADRMMAVVYFRVVLVKGLLPQLVLALALWALLRRAWPGVERSFATRAVGLAGLGLAAYAVVAPLLLSADLPGWPALQMRTLEHQIATAFQSVIGVVAAALLGRRLCTRRR